MTEEPITATCVRHEKPAKITMRNVFDGSWELVFECGCRVRLSKEWVYLPLVEHMEKEAEEHDG